MLEALKFQQEEQHVYISQRSKRYPLFFTGKHIQNHVSSHFGKMIGEVK